MSTGKFSNQNWRPLVIRDNFLFVRGNVANFETKGGETGVNALTGFNNNPGSFSDVPAVIAVAHEFGKAAQPGNIRTIDSEVLFDFAGTTDITSGQSIAAVRACINIGSATRLGSGLANEYVYGVQGKIQLQGRSDQAAGFCAGVFGQYDSSGASAVITSGYHAAIHADMGATSILASSSFLNMYSGLNTTQCLINSCFKVIANASFFMDLSESNLTGNWIVGTTASTAAGTLKVKVNGATRYIQLFSGVA